MTKEEDLLVAKFLSIIVIIIAIIIWACSGWYTVGPAQEGVEIRLGRYYRTTEPGLHFHLPQPFGDVTKIKKTEIRRLEVGSMKNPISVLTRDENLVDVALELQWSIKSTHDYLFRQHHKDIIDTISNVSESAIRQIISENDVGYLLEGAGREQLTNKFHDLLQYLFDKYSMGINITSVQFKAIDPPHEVIEAFRDVQSARANKENNINLAQGYANSILPEARGQAAQIINEAKAYREEVVNAAKGENQRFLSMYKKYEDNKESTVNMMHIEALDEVLKNSDKVIIIDEKVNSFNHLSLQDLIKSKK